MSLEKFQFVDKIEVVPGEIIQVRQVTKIVDGGEEVANNFHRWTLTPGQDVSDQDPRVQAICRALWTPEVIDAFNSTIPTQPEVLS